MSKEYRYERKYPMDLQGLYEFRFWHRMYGGEFRTAYPKRIVNSIYFDSIELDNYNDNLSGNSERFKSRLRWYGDNLKIDKMQFEIKKRKNAVGYKETQIITDARLMVENIAELYKKIRPKLNNNIRNQVDKMRCPTVLNQYLREYYVTRDDIRLTVDTDMKYASLLSRKNLPDKLVPSEVKAVVEIKYSINKDEKVRNILQTVPFSIDKNSKYVNAVEEI